jgi:hypothetical protein
MSYKCQVCQAPVRAGTPRKIWTVYKHISVKVAASGITLVPTRQIEREVPVCQACHNRLIRGESLTGLVTRYAEAIRGDLARKEMGSRIYVPVPSVNVNALADVPGSGDGDLFPHADQEPPRCDVCGGNATGGQAVEDSILCPKCLRKAGGKGKRGK